MFGCIGWSAGGKGPGSWEHPARAEAWVGTGVRGKVCLAIEENERRLENKRRLEDKMKSRHDFVGKRRDAKSGRECR
jgi:hypothetical protein